MLLHSLVHVTTRRIIELNTPMRALKYLGIKVEGRDCQHSGYCPKSNVIFKSQNRFVCLLEITRQSVLSPAALRCLETHCVNAAFGSGNWNGWVDNNGPDDAGMGTFPPRDLMEQMPM